MRKKKKIKLKKDHKNTGILPVLLIIALLSLFSETVRTIPVGALSEKLNNISYKLPELNSSLIEAKLLKKDGTSYIVIAAQLDSNEEIVSGTRITMTANGVWGE